MSRILDPQFAYVPSHETDIRKTFERVRKELELFENDQQAHANDIDPETGCTQEEMR